MLFVSDSQSRIADYRRHADEVAMAEGATDPVLRRHHTRLAETYLQLIDMELRRIGLRKPVHRPS